MFKKKTPETRNFHDFESGSFATRGHIYIHFDNFQKDDVGCDYIACPLAAFPRWILLQSIHRWGGTSYVINLLRS